jgi:tetratricopeptide (TPR) repeat protein
VGRLLLSLGDYRYGLFAMKGISLAIAISLLSCTAVAQTAQARGKETIRPQAELAQMSRYQEAEVVWQRLAVQNPSNAEVHYNLGIALANQQKWQAAIDSFEQAIAINPKFVHAYCNLGRAQTKLEQYQAAAQSYRQALAFDPTESLAKELLDELKIIARGRGVDLAVLSLQS